MKKSTATIGFGAFLLASMFCITLLPQPFNFFAWGSCLTIATYCMGWKHALESKQTASISDNKTKEEQQ